MKFGFDPLAWQAKSLPLSLVVLVFRGLCGFNVLSIIGFTVPKMIVINLILHLIQFQQYNMSDYGKKFTFLEHPATHKRYVIEKRDSIFEIEGRNYSYTYLLAKIEQDV